MPEQKETSKSSFPSQFEKRVGQFFHTSEWFWWTAVPGPLVAWACYHFFKAGL